MAQTIICAVCGGEISADKKFCKFCGSPVEATISETVASAEPPAPTEMPTCPHCGALLKNAGQKFCGSCGGVIDATSATPAAAPTVAVGGTAPVAAASTSVAASKDAVKDGISKASARLDNFMGASLDLESVGKDFDADAITFASINDAELAKAYAFFGKSFEKVQAQETNVTDVTGAPVQRRSSEGEEEKAARAKESRDFSAHAGTAVFGSLSSQLRAEFAPKVEMIVEQRDKAASKEQKDRLKHKVALGDMDKRTAVELAEE